MKREQDETTNEILIAGLTPYFLEKPLFWFRENLTKIKLSAKTQSWWRNRTLFLKKDQKIALSSFLRRLDELGYEKVQKNSLPGEFSRLGGTIEIFPINSSCPLRIEFFGNRIENVAGLPKEIGDEDRLLILNRKIGSKKKAELLKNLLPGDYVVHVDHGIEIGRASCREGGKI